MGQDPFRTAIQLGQGPAWIAHGRQLWLAGSCFSEHIGHLLQTHQFTAQVNPFGVIFNPVSLQKLMAAALGKGTLTPGHVLNHQGVYLHYDLHSRFGSADAVSLEQKLAALWQEAGHWLRHTEVVLLTLGTAWVYVLKETGEIVANCHKQPAHLFEKRLLSVEEVHQSLQVMQSLLPAQTRVMLTVSPVRHVKDSLPLNQVSKSVLRLAAHVFASESDRVHYFPAYEIMMDDLRDYRFYAPDLIHPNEVAIRYIWEHFVAHAMDDTTQGRVAQWAAIQQGLDHRPQFTHVPAYRQFLARLEQQLLAIDWADVSAALDQVREKMAAIPRG
jgi:hypothetical protein